MYYFLHKNNKNTEQLKIFKSKIRKVLNWTVISTILLQVFDQLINVFHTECSALFSTWCMDVETQVHSKTQILSEEIRYGRHMFLFVMLQILMKVSCKNAVLKHIMTQNFVENIVCLFHTAFDCPKLQFEVSLLF